MRNSVLVGLRARRLEFIQADIIEKADSSSVTDVANDGGVKEKNS